MRSFWYSVMVMHALGAGAAQTAAADDAAQAEFRAKFEKILDGLNENSFDSFNAAISKSDMTQRILGTRLVDPQVKDLLRNDFKSSIEEWFAGSFPDTGGKEIIGTLIDFKAQGNQASALVRYALPKYRYAYHLYDLRLDNRGRIIIADWLDYLMAQRFSDAAGEYLVSVMPSDSAARKLDRKSVV